MYPKYMSEIKFLKPPEFYQRDIEPVSQYISQTSFYLSKMSGKPQEECKTKLVARLKDKQTNSFHDPVVHFMSRGDNKDTAHDTLKLTEYIRETIKSGEILAPTFTTYLNPKVERSLLVEFIDRNVKIRGKSKKEAFAAKAAGNQVLYLSKNNEQSNMKNYNNSMSGAFASDGSVLRNPTAHSTLTSITRTEGSLGNASNEKIIAGNRHYKDPNTTLNNVIYIASTIDRESIARIVSKYNLHIPTVQDVNDCIRYSSDLYWKDPYSYQRIDDFVRTLDDYERAAFVYIGDLYHIRKHNDQLVRDLLTRLARKITIGEIEDPIKTIHSHDEQIVNFAHQICSNEVKGIGKDYSKLNESSLKILALTCLNIQKVIEDYFDFFDALFLTKVIPASTAYIPNMVRRSVVLSDTDSTMFSVDEFVNWYFGEIVFTEEAFALASSVMFIATQCIAHCLAIFSANLNVERPKLFAIAMKPEFSFPVFAQTPVAKHYFTCIAVQEGNVFSDVEMEIKGVHLKNSAAPKELISAAHQKMKDILALIRSNQKINLSAEIKEVANIERMITQSLLSNELRFYKQSKIKDKQAYSLGPERSPYLYHILWEDVFEPKYGKTDQVPYNVIKIPTIMENRSSYKAWLDGIQDREFAERMMKWSETYGKDKLPTIYISAQFVKSFGIPIELKSIINVKKIVLDLTIVNRMILETLGYCPKPEMLLGEMGY